MERFYREKKEGVLKELNTSLENGLSDQQVKEHIKKYGNNELKEINKKGTIQIFFEQFKDFLVIILIVASIISMFMGDIKSSIVIIVVLVINATLGTIQHIKAEQSLNSLRKLSAPMAKVFRDGKKIEIPSREVVVGDILYLEAGDYVCADGRVIENYSLQVIESSLTGESESVSKTSEVIYKEEVTIGDRINMVFSSGLVTYGRAIVCVTAVGMNTEIGKIATLLETAEERKTPLQQSLDDFGKKLAIAILIICAIVFGLNIYRGYALVESFMFAVALAVAAIPEALSSIVTIVLALGTQKMAAENAIIRKLQAVETLGCTSVICSDKTGTLTQNKMTVKKIFVDDNIMEELDMDKEDKLQKGLILMSLLCNDAVTTGNKEMGDPTEVALVNFGDIYNIDEIVVRQEYERVSEIPFDSDRKLMSTVHIINGSKTMITKGAVDVLLNKISKIEKSTGVFDFNEEEKRNIEKINKEFSQDGLRVLVFALKQVDDTEIEIEDEADLTFIGLIAMMDPPRKESKYAVESCIKAGIKPVMITGDHKITAATIAKQIGILKNNSEAVEGYELDKLSDEELKQKIDNISVYARVSPEHKIRIVKAWQEKGNIVAMTGDGVNDAPALKQADIGVAMGVTGTEVAKDASSMILTDDNFSTIVKSISNGRSIYSNIKNSIKFLLSGNTAGILSVLYASLMALPNPFAPVHLLFINLITDSLPAIALGLEPHNRNAMNEKPRDVNAPILNKKFSVKILLEGIIIAACTMAAFYIGYKNGDQKLGSTMAFATLCLARLFHGFNCRGRESIFKLGIFSNKYSWYALIIGFILLNAVLLVAPLRNIFEVAPININELKIIYGLSITPLIIIQTYKILIKR